MQPNYLLPSKEELTKNARDTGQFAASDYQLSEINMLKNGVNMSKGSRFKETTLLGKRCAVEKSMKTHQCGRMLERWHQKEAIVLLQKKHAG